MHSETITPPASQEPNWLEALREKIAQMRYGVVELTVHDGRVTQIQCTEKIRVPFTRD